MFFFRDKSLNVYQIKVCGALGLFVFMIFNFSMILFCFFSNWFCEEKFVPFLFCLWRRKACVFSCLGISDFWYRDNVYIIFLWIAKCALIIYFLYVYCLCLIICIVACQLELCNNRTSFLHRGYNFLSFFVFPLP